MFTFKKFAAIGIAAFTALSLSSCSDDPEDATIKNPSNLVRKSFILSNAGSSYGDLDGAQIYKQAALTDAVKEKIDLVAYYTSGASDEVKNPCYVPTIGEDCGMPELYEIPQTYWASLKDAQTTADIEEFLTAYDAGTIDADEVDEISISTGKAFFVWSTDIKPYVVVITTSGAETVSLSFFEN